METDLKQTNKDVKSVSKRIPSYKETKFNLDSSELASQSQGGVPPQDEAELKEI